MSSRWWGTSRALQGQICPAAPACTVHSCPYTKLGITNINARECMTTPYDDILWTITLNTWRINRFLKIHVAKAECVLFFIPLYNCVLVGFYGTSWPIQTEIWYTHFFTLYLKTFYFRKVILRAPSFENLPCHMHVCSIPLLLF